MYSKTKTVVLAIIISSTLFVLIFSYNRESSLLLIWLLTIILLSIGRYFLYNAFIKRKDNSQIKRWGNAFIYASLVSSIVWGVAWFIVSDKNDMFTISLVGMFAMGITSSSFSTYIIYIKGLLFFFIPVISMLIINYLYIGGVEAISIALSFILYSLIVLRSAFHINSYLIDSILNKFKLEDEIIEREKIQAQLLKLSIIDDLTALYNRRHFDERLYSELNSSQRTKLSVSMMIIDIDNFKNFNDNYGHTNGDDCLYKVSQAIKNTLKRDGDLTFRYGGEEIAVLLPNTKLDDAKLIAEEIRLNVQNINIEHKYSDVEDVEVVTVSLGVGTTVAKKDFSSIDFISEVDVLLYKAKRNGKNQVVSS